MGVVYIGSVQYRSAKKLVTKEKNEVFMNTLVRIKELHSLDVLGARIYGAYINGARIDGGTIVQRDAVTIVIASTRHCVTVEALGTRRGPAPAAASSFRTTGPSPSRPWSARASRPARSVIATT